MICHGSSAFEGGLISDSEENAPRGWTADTSRLAILLLPNVSLRGALIHPQYVRWLTIDRRSHLEDSGCILLSNLSSLVNL